MLQRAFCVLWYAITYIIGHAGKPLCKVSRYCREISGSFVILFCPPVGNVLPYFVFFHARNNMLQREFRV